MRMPWHTSRLTPACTTTLLDRQPHAQRRQLLLCARRQPPRQRSCSRAPRKPCLPRWAAILPPRPPISPARRFRFPSHNAFCPPVRATPSLPEKNSETTISVLRDIVESVPVSLVIRPAVSVQQPSRNSGPQPDPAPLSGFLLLVTASPLRSSCAVLRCRRGIASRALARTSALAALLSPAGWRDGLVLFSQTQTPLRCIWLQNGVPHHP